jgi:hypothetical protein
MRQREPERLVQVEAIREHVTRLAGAWASGDNAAAESIRQATLALVGDFMEAVDKDRDEGLDPDTARAWKDQVHEIAVQESSTSSRRKTVGAARAHQYPRKPRTA